jgi:hypothetical protein
MRIHKTAITILLTPFGSGISGSGKRTTSTTGSSWSRSRRKSLFAACAACASPPRRRSRYLIRIFSFYVYEKRRQEVQSLKDGYWAKIATRPSFCGSMVTKVKIMRLGSEFLTKYGTCRSRVRYHSVCPLVGIGTPTLSPGSECAPPCTTGGGTHACGVRGWGSPNSDD